MNQRYWSWAGVLLCAMAEQAHGEVMMQEGTLSGAEGPVAETLVVLSQFDDAGGTRTLNFVQFDVLTTLDASYTTNGLRDEVEAFLLMGASYFLGQQELIVTQALLDDHIHNHEAGKEAALHLEDAGQLVIADAGELAAWIGSGTVELSVFTQLTADLIPQDAIPLAASGATQWRVTYDYTEVPGPAGLTAMVLGWMAGGSRRRGAADFKV